MPRVDADIEEAVLENEDGDRIKGLRATCSLCGFVTESYGRSARSLRRCLVMMRDDCPLGDDNHYMEG